MKTFLLSVVLLSFSSLVGFQANAQEQHDDELHHIDAHYDKPNEIGGAIGPVFDITENRVGVGIHLHYTRMLKDKLENFGIGAGFETVFTEHNHYSFSVVFVYRPTHPWWIAVAPGVTYFDENDQTKFSMHFETGYEFDVDVIHLGPMIEYAFAGNDHHILIGVHLGYPF